MVHHLKNNQVYACNNMNDIFKICFHAMIREMKTKNHAFALVRI